MPINIKEIFYPGDSDQIKWDKINYNFDQVLANGGKQGPVGTKGSTGTIGATGVKGTTGSKGDQGVKGDTGVSTNFWDRQSHTNGVSFVVKPKDDTNTSETAVFIGDTTYEEGVDDGILDQNAQLTVKNSTGFAFAQKWLPDGDGTTSPHGVDSLTVRGTGTLDYDGNNNPGTLFIIQPELNTNNSTKLSIEADVLDFNGYNKINIQNLNGVNFLAGGTITFNPTATFVDAVAFSDNVTVAGTVSISGDLTASANSYFGGTGFIKVPGGTTAQRPASAQVGMIRYNNQVNKFEGYESTAWKDLTRLSNNTKATYVSVQADTDYTLSTDNKVNIVAGGLNIMDLNTTEVNVTRNLKLGNAANAYFLGGSKGIVYPAGGLKPSGFPAAGTVYYSSPSNGSAELLRNLNDYFYMDSYSPAATSGDTLVFGYANADGPTITWFDQGTAAGEFVKEDDTKVTYTKIGHHVFVNGYYQIQLPSSFPADTGADDTNDTLVIGLGENDGTSTSGGVTGEPSQFPFINSSGSDILVDVKIWGVDINTHASASQHVEPYQNVEIFGLIPPGKGFIKLYFIQQNVATSSTAVDLEMRKKSLSPGQINRLASTTATPMEISFSFNMPTIVNTGRNSYSTVGSGTQQGGGLQQG